MNDNVVKRMFSLSGQKSCLLVSREISLQLFWQTVLTKSYHFQNSPF